MMTLSIQYESIGTHEYLYAHKHTRFYAIDSGIGTETSAGKLELVI